MTEKEGTDRERMRVLFMHNSLPEYRVAFWRRLSELCGVDICVTHPELESKLYGFDFDGGGLSVLEEDAMRVDPAGYDVVVLPPADSVLDLRVSARLVRECRGKGIPTVYWSEAWMPKSGNWSAKRKIKRALKRKASEYVARRATACIAAGSRADGYLRRLGAGDVRIVVDATEVGPVDEAKAREVWASLPENRTCVLYFGRLKKIKGTEYLAAAFAELCRERDDLFLLVCGDGECWDELESSLRSACPEGSWRMEGKVDPRYRASYYSVARVFVLPSCTYDGQVEIWGLSVNESLEAGVPVVTTTAVGSGPELINPSVGEVVPEGDAHALAGAISSVADRNAGGAMAPACREVARKHSVDSMAEGFYNVFEGLVGTEAQDA